MNTPSLKMDIGGVKHEFRLELGATVNIFSVEDRDTIAAYQATLQDQTFAALKTATQRGLRAALQTCVSDGHWRYAGNILGDSSGMVWVSRCTMPRDAKGRCRACYMYLVHRVTKDTARVAPHRT